MFCFFFSHKLRQKWFLTYFDGSNTQKRKKLIQVWHHFIICWFLCMKLTDLWSKVVHTLYTDSVPFILFLLVSHMLILVRPFRELTRHKCIMFCLREPGIKNTGMSSKSSLNLNWISEPKVLSDFLILENTQGLSALMSINTGSCKTHLEVLTSIQVCTGTFICLWEVTLVPTHSTIVTPGHS